MAEGLTAEVVRERLEGAASQVTLTLSQGSERLELQKRLEEVAALVVEAAPETVLLEQGIANEETPTPSLTLASGDRRIRYSVAPDGPEAEPFLEALAAMASVAGGDEAPWHAALAEVEAPAELLVLVAPGCPHCPHAVRAANSLAAAGGRVKTTIVDGFAFPELMERYSVRSVPVTLVDGELTLVGVVASEELVERIRARGETGFDLERFRSWLDGGRFDDAAAEVVRGPGAGLFLKVWQVSATSDRMALLLVAEQTLTAGPEALDGVVPALVELLGADDAALRGDTADLLGQIGHSAARGPLTALLDDPNPDVAEIAEESLESLRS